MDIEKWCLGSGEIYAYVQTYKGIPKVHLRNFRAVESGKRLPTVKGVTLKWDEWETLKSLVQTLDLEFRKQLSQRVETPVTRPWYYGAEEIPSVSTFEDVCPSHEGNH